MLVTLGLAIDTPIKYKYQFHAAGQGVFASGRLCLPDGNPYGAFDWVVDCGSTAPKAVLRPEVQRYRQSTQDNLDLLCLTHFDDDHVNGLADLLEGLHIGTVVIPYYSPWERLAIASRSVRPTEAYYAFMRNPIRFLIERADSIGRIIVVGDPPPGNPAMQDEGGDDQQDRNRDWQLKIRGVRTLGKGRVSDTTSAYAKMRRCRLQEVDPFMTAVARNGQTFADWEFLFFHKPLPAVTKLRVKRGIEKILGERLGRTPSSLRKILGSSERRRKIRKAYVEILSGSETINSASLCVYSGPLVYDAHLRISLSNKCLAGSQPQQPLYSDSCTFLEGRCSILYTGDSNLKSVSNRIELEQFLGDDRWQSICILQVPHHGSKANWQEGIGVTMPSSFAVFCADPAHRFKHPHRDVVEDFSSQIRCHADKMLGWVWEGDVVPF